MFDRRSVLNHLIAALLFGAFFTLHCLILKKFELCVFRSICGMPCPGCGMVHAATALFFRGDLIESLRFNLFFIPVSIFLFFSFFPHGVWPLADAVKRCRKWFTFLLLLLLIYYIIRMILYFPSDQYPMVYDPRNYLHILWNLIFSG